MTKATCVSKWNPVNADGSVKPATRQRPGISGFDEGPCKCAKCLKRSGPLKESIESLKDSILKVLLNENGGQLDLPVEALHPDKYPLLHPEEVLLLHPEEDSLAPIREKAFAIVDAADSGDTTKLENLLLAVKDEDCRVDIASELMLLGAQNGNASLISMLWELGASAQQMDSSGIGTPLMHAANNGHVQAVKELLSMDVELDLQNSKGHTALIVAVISDRANVAEVLLETGADVDKPENTGRTPLMMAASYGAEACCKLLLSYGADLYATDNGGYTAMDRAHGGTLEILRKGEVRMRMQEKRRHKAERQVAQPVLDSLTHEQCARREEDALNMAAQLLMQEEAEKQRQREKKARKKKGKEKKSSISAVPISDQDDSCSASGSAAGCSSQLSPRVDMDASNGDQPSSSTNGSLPSTTAQTHKQVRHWLEELVLGKRNSSPAIASQSSQQPDPMYPSTSMEYSQIPYGQAQSASINPVPSTSTLHSTLSADPRSFPSQPDDLRSCLETTTAEASKCIDPTLQPALLARLTALLPICSSAGISVKYARKVLQRLEAVGPAREALCAAVNAKVPSRSSLDTALQGIKSVRSLLDPALVSVAEQLLERLTKEEEEAKWAQIADQLKWDNRVSANGSAPEVEDEVVTDELESDVECVVCLEEVKTACCVPCGHVCMCQTCAADIQASTGMCPVCRTQIECVLEVSC